MINGIGMVSHIPARAPLPAGKGKRVLLDTNVWRYIIDSNTQGRLLRAAEGSYEIIVAPAVLYETLRFKDAAKRAALIKLMTNQRFVRLMPEAYSESMEILWEVERLKPDWLRDKPDVRFFDRLRKDWSRRTGGFWVRCARSPESEARFIQAQESGLIERAHAEVKDARKEMDESGLKRVPPMDTTMGGFNQPVAGWRGDQVHAWRIETLAGMTHGLREKGNPYRDWTGPFMELDTGLLSSPEWVEF